LGHTRTQDKPGFHEGRKEEKPEEGRKDYIQYQPLRLKGDRPKNTRPATQTTDFNVKHPSRGKAGTKKKLHPCRQSRLIELLLTSSSDGRYSSSDESEHVEAPNVRVCGCGTAST
jgi:hypothetical protein